MACVKAESRWIWSDAVGTESTTDLDKYDENSCKWQGMMRLSHLSCAFSQPTTAHSLWETVAQLFPIKVIGNWFLRRSQGSTSSQAANRIMSTCTPLPTIFLMHRRGMTSVGRGWFSCQNSGLFEERHSFNSLDDQELDGAVNIASMCLKRWKFLPSRRYNNFQFYTEKKDW